MLKRYHLLVKLLTILIFLFCSNAYANKLVLPNPSIAPGDVVAIQLMGLKNNDLLENDFGIRQAWNFAHPKNRKFTGPLPRFSMMLKGPGYNTLLNHKSHKILTDGEVSKGQTDEGEAWRQFDVLLETTKGTILYFSWVVQKVGSGQYKDCWMTVSVSTPTLAGQSG